MLGLVRTGPFLLELPRQPCKLNSERVRANLPAAMIRPSSMRMMRPNVPGEPPLLCALPAFPRTPQIRAGQGRPRDRYCAGHCVDHPQAEARLSPGHHMCDPYPVVRCQRSRQWSAAKRKGAQGTAYATTCRGRRMIEVQGATSSVPGVNGLLRGHIRGMPSELCDVGT